MSSAKQHYLEAIRSGTAYPVYRGFIGTIAMIGYLLAGVSGLAALIAGLTMMSKESTTTGIAVLLAGGIYAALVFMLARLFREGALIVADMADSIVDTNSKVWAER